MISQKFAFALLIAACVSLSTPQKTHAANIPVVIAGLATMGTAVTGATYLEYKSVRDETSEKTWNRFGWDVLSFITAPVFPLSWYCTYKSIKGKNWGKRLFLRIGSRASAGIAMLSIYGTALAATS